MSLNNAGYALHMNPVWRDKANFIIDAELGEGQGKYEQLWVRKIENQEKQFEVCCIPAFLYGIALGDIVETQGTEKGKLVLDRVVERSGHHVFRLWFGNVAEVHKSDTIENLKKMQPISLELYSDSLLLVDVENESRARELADYLQSKEDQGWFEYEDGDANQ